MNDRKINILGSEWTIKEQSETENELLKNCDGYCDWTTKEIVIEREINGTLSDMQQYIKKLLGMRSFTLSYVKVVYQSAVESLRLGPQTKKWLTGLLDKVLKFMPPG